MPDDYTKPVKNADGNDSHNQFPEGKDAQGRDSAAPKVDPVWGSQSPLDVPGEGQAGDGETVSGRSADERALYEAAERSYPDVHIRRIMELRIFGLRTGFRVLRTERRHPKETRGGIIGFFQKLVLVLMGKNRHNHLLQCGAFPEPPLPTEPVPGEPPEVRWMLKPWRPILWLCCAVIGGIWGPVMLAGYGRRLAAQDRVAWEQRYGVPMPLVVPTAGETGTGDGEACNSAKMVHAVWGMWRTESQEENDLRTRDSRYVEQKDGRWVDVFTNGQSSSRYLRDEQPKEFEDADRDLNLYREDFDSVLFPGRSASTYEPGSVYFEFHRAQSVREVDMQRALACGYWPAFPTYSALWEWLDESNYGLYSRLVQFWGYRLHRAAFTRDWSAFERELDDLFTVLYGISPRYGMRVMEMLQEVLAQHGYAMPDATLDTMDLHLRSLPNDPPDEALEVAAWEQTVRRRLISASLREKGDGYLWTDVDTPYPVFLQTYAMRYPWTRGSIPDGVARLSSNLRMVISMPGRTNIGMFKGNFFSYDPEGMGAFADDLARTVDLSLMAPLTGQRLMLAGIGALRVRRATGAWPEALDECVEAPYRIDPMSATFGDLSLRVDSAGCLRLWSVAGNGVDDGGRMRSELVQPKTGRQNSDAVLRLYWPPAPTEEPAAILDDCAPTPEDRP